MGDPSVTATVPLSFSALRNIKGQIREHGCSPDLVALLRSDVDADVLVGVREQKVLLGYADRHQLEQCLDEYRRCARRIYASSPDEAERWENYATFVGVITDLRAAVATRARDVVEQMPRLGTVEIAELACAFAADWFQGISDRMWTNIKGELAVTTLSAGERSALSERALHEIKGSTNDALFALARALNECFRHADHNRKHRTGRAGREGFLTKLPELIALASVWNSYDYVTDQVTYGEWTVASITRDTPCTICFDLIDPVLALARIIGLRRDAVATHLGRERASALRQSLDDIRHEFCTRASELLTRGSAPLTPPAIYDLLNILKYRLSSLDPGDDFLIGAARDRRAQSEYLGVLALGWLGDIQRGLPATLRRRSFGTLQRRLGDLGALLPLAEEQQREMTDALRHRAARVPTQHHLDLIRTPFFLSDDDQLVHLPCLDGATWNSEIRARWLRDGVVGKRYGRTWEDLFAHLFGATGWLVVGPGVKLRTAKGRTATDVDLLAFRDDVLLVIQVKGQAGQGINPYDHWRARQTIEQGARQARIATAVIEAAPRERLKAIFSARIAASVRVIQPLVITNAHVFNGWKPNGVPVLSRNGLNTILHGGVVTYEDGHGRATESIAVADQAVPPAARFLDMLQNPIDWRIAHETMQVLHTAHMVEGNTFQIPTVGTWRHEPTPITPIPTPEIA